MDGGSGAGICQCCLSPELVRTHVALPVGWIGLPDSMVAGSQGTVTSESKADAHGISVSNESS